MRYCNLNRVCLLLLTLVILSCSGKVHAQSDNWSIIQLTNNSYYDQGPKIYGSNVVWYGYDGNDLEIFFYDGNTITQITDNSLHDASLQIHGSNVVWVGDDGNDEEIFLAKPVPPPVEAAMKLTPQMLNCNSKGKYVKAHLTLPEEFLPQDVDVNKPAWVEPMGIESESIKVLGAGAGPVRLEITFDREAFCDSITETGEVEITVIGSLTTSRYFYATDTIKIKPQHQRITYRYKKNQHNQRPMKTLRPQRPRR